MMINLISLRVLLLMVSTNRVLLSAYAYFFTKNVVKKININFICIFFHSQLSTTESDAYVSCTLPYD